MIVDVYKCPRCGVNVYLSEEEDSCPLCGMVHRDDMKEEKLDVDLSIDASLKKGAHYAHFKHFSEVLRVMYCGRAGLYIKDCWKYAWNPENCDSENKRQLLDFVSDPNGTILGRRDTSMTREEMQAEIERLINLIYSKSSGPRTEEERNNYNCSFVKKDALVRIFVKKDFTYVTADACFKHTHLLEVYNYEHVEKKKPFPMRKADYHVIETCLPVIGFDRDLSHVAPSIAKDITDRLYGSSPSKLKLGLRKLSSRITKFMGL